MTREHQTTTRERLREQLRAGPARRQDGRDRGARPRDAVVRAHAGLVGRGDRRQPARHAAGHVSGPDAAAARLPVPEALEHLTQEEAQKLIDMDARRARGDRARRAGRHHLRRRDRQDRRPRGRAGPGRQPRGRAARHPADRRRHDGQHQVRHGADRSHPVHRRRRVSRVEAVGSDSRAAGPVSDSRRARAARHATSSSAS